MADVTAERKSTAKRDELIVDEKRFQNQWQSQNVFHSNAPSIQEFPPNSTTPIELQKRFPKWMGTMAYPYMNGTGHMGHAFTMSRVEFGSRVARMQGKRALFPQGWHCTGMPIKACADKLTREIELFGPNFENCPESHVVNGDAPVDPPAPTQAVTKEDVTKFGAKKSKANAKTVKAKWQWQIMVQQGVPREDIHKFADPDHWLQYFPPLWKRDMTSFGCSIDWRRSMVTTDANPFYDSFVRWQMNRLKELGKIKFGKRYTVYSPKDMQACMDHDRSEGEGVGVQEYTALKLKVKEWPEAARSKLHGKVPESANVFFIPATLRPETMYGQNCCFVGPSILYGVFKIGSDYFFCSDRAARNMAYQNITSEWGQVEKVVELQGSDVVGTLVHAPLSVHTQGIRILPMDTVKASKGTGVVTCVPSDSPDDYATIIDLIKKPEFYNIKKEWAELEIIPVIETPSYGNLTAKKLCEDMKINSPKDVKQLAEAKDLAYKEGFYKGTMVYGDFKGEPVTEAKEKVRKQLIDAGDAFNYAEPDGFVLSRSGDDCVAAYLDQWFVNYGKTDKGGDGAWQQQVVDYINEGLNTFSDEVKAGFQGTLDWLANWSVARPYGLGTRLPWDHSFLVESLSDSTIYMGYYTVAHLLHTDIFGNNLGPANIQVEQLTDEVWDYVFCRADAVDSSIPKDTLLSLRREFEYWYPWDVRVSGKDLIQNHLTFCLYHHIALFPKDKWPKGIRANGHLLLNSEKMSKSTGNFLTMRDAIEKYGTDATRLALADAGDSVDDANFDESVADSTILRMYELRDWCRSIVKDAIIVKSQGEYMELRDSKKIKNTDTIQRTGSRTFLDNTFDDEMNTLAQQAQANYDGYLFKAALKSALYEFTGARDAYRSATHAAGIGMHVELTRRYVELQALLIAPLAPHWAEGQWMDVLGHSDSIQAQQFPKVPEPDVSLTAAREYARSASSQITSAEGAQMKKLAKGKQSSYDPKADKKITIFAAQAYPKWQDDAIEVARQSFEGMSIDMKQLAKKLPKAESKRAMPFITTLKKQIDAGKSQKEVFERKLPFDELFVLKEMAVTLKQAVQKCKIVEIISVEEGGKAGSVVAGTEGVKEGERRETLPVFAEHCTPGNPTFHFENV